jgi:glycosyltransferase involved in cell wall biosynthesis
MASKTNIPDDNGLAKLSVVLPVLNEEENLPAALASVTWVDEVIVVDSGSTDATSTIATQAGAQVVEFKHNLGGPKKKGWSLRNIQFHNDWVLFLDGDERITSLLQAEIERVLREPLYDGYYLDREMYFRGRKLSCYRPDWNLRLFRHALASIEDLGLHDLPGTGDNEIHEHFIIDGSTGFLKSPLLHNDYRGIGPWIERHNKYATWEAHLYRRWREQPISFRFASIRDPVARNRMLRRIWVRLPGRPFLRFLVWLFGKRAFRDGSAGLVYSFLMGWYELIIGFKLSELEAKQSEHPVSASAHAIEQRR